MSDKQRDFRALSPFTAQALPAAQEREALLSCNQITAAHGLILSPAQAVAVVRSQQASLAQAGRLAFDGGAAAAIAQAFCDSRYLTQENYADTLMALIDIFYQLQNDTEDALDDETLIAAMKNAFEDECRGEVELLAAKFLPEFVRQLRLRGAADWTEECYDDE